MRPHHPAVRGLAVKKHLIPLAAAILLAAAFLMGPGRDDSPSFSLPAENEFRNVPPGEIEPAFLKFMERASEESPLNIHSSAHDMGQALYAHLGARGILPGLDCDGVFNWGCAHGFLEALAADRGLDALPSLGEFCPQAPWPGRCYHSIGHGLVFLSGYDVAGLRQALQDCDRLQLEGRRPCYGGAFKEYNDRSFLPAEGERVLRDKDALLEPCASFPGYEQECYYELPYWWRTIMDLPKMAEVCESAADPAIQARCARGVGRAVLVTVRYENAPMAEICGTFRSESGRALCVEEVVSILSSTHGEKKMLDQSTVYYVPAPEPVLCEVLRESANRNRCLDSIRTFECEKLNRCEP